MSQVLNDIYMKIHRESCLQQLSKPLKKQVLKRAEAEGIEPRVLLERALMHVLATVPVGGLMELAGPAEPKPQRKAKGKAE